MSTNTMNERIHDDARADDDGMADLRDILKAAADEANGHFRACFKADMQRTAEADQRDAWRALQIERELTIHRRGN